MQPIIRLGTIDKDIVEANPFVFKGELYRFEYIRYACFSRPYYRNDSGNSYFRIIRVRDGFEMPRFGFGLAMGIAYSDGDRVVVTAVADHKTVRPYLYQLESTDLISWTKPKEVFGGHEWRIHNSTICRNEDRYILSFECDHPEGNFCMRFLESDDLRSFKMIPDAIFRQKSGYTGGPIIRWFDGWFYIFYITGGYETRFDWNVARSRNLKDWESSARNPIMVSDDAEDKKLHPACILDDHEIEIMRNAKNINVSDMDFCEWQGRLEMIYTWGDQKGHEYYSLATCNATERQFCEQYF